MYKSNKMKQKQRAYPFDCHVKRHDDAVLILPFWRGPCTRSGVLGSYGAHSTPTPACRTSVRLLRSVPARQKKCDARRAKNRDLRRVFVWVNVTEGGCLIRKHTTAQRELTASTGARRIRIHHASPLLGVPFPSSLVEASVSNSCMKSQVFLRLTSTQ